MESTSGQFKIIVRIVDTNNQELETKNLYFKSWQKQKKLLDFLLENNLDVSHSCGGNSTCGTCLILVDSDIKLLPPRNSTENEISSDKRFLNTERLSCQLNLIDGLKITIKKY